MISFNTDSWHYNLVLYVFGPSFFFDKQVDDKLLRKKIKKIEEETRRLHPNDDKALEGMFRTGNLFEDDIYMFIPKSVNFCPYCRAIVSSVVLLPFAALSKLIPKRKQKPFDIKKSRRNLKIMKIVAIGIMSLLGVHSIIQGNYLMALFHFGIASFQFWGKYVFDWYIKWRLNKPRKEKPVKTENKKESSLFSAYIHTKHSKICPPVTFVDKNDTEKRV